jgi:DNA mismatch repair ATPase MutS
MGGKTAVLKTAAFLQLLAQSGFFVPAASFSAPLVDAVDYVGEDAREPLAGLSSFGLELHAVLALLAAPPSRRLVLIDEFAKTTGSREGAALLSALLGAFSRRPLWRTLAATHLTGLALPDGAGAYRMRGFDEDAFRKDPGPSAGRLADIHRFMRYEIVEDDGAPRASDALKVARVLGLDAAVVDDAERLLEKSR